MADKVTIHIDGIAHSVEAGTNLLQACLSLQLDMPYFCWHPALGSAGSCRQCAVLQYQNAEDERGRLVMACMTPVAEGMIVSMAAEKATTFRATAIEAIMTNHPHDCPVCEEGGDCHLQDMTLMSGHIKRQYPGTKRTHLNQYLGPLLNHEMNRCIGCYRCIRFYRDHCGGDDLNVFASRNHIYFGRAQSGVLENEFSGNLAEVCPTGVFTDKTYSEHYVRKWDLQSAPTICTHCSVGCNTYSGERNGVLRRITNRFNPEVNGHFLCDRGRFGYEHVNHSEKLEQPLKRNNTLQQVDLVAVDTAQTLLTKWYGQGNTIAVGSARSSIENNGALYKLSGKTHFFADLPDSRLAQLKLLSELYQTSKLQPLSLQQLETSDAALVVAEDITQTAPRVALALRQMTRNAGLDKAAKMGIKPWQDEAVRNIAQDLRSPLHIIDTHKTHLMDVAKLNICLAPSRQLALLLEIESLLKHPEDQDIASAEAVSIAADLQTATHPAIIAGINDKQILRVCLRISLLLDKGGCYCPTGEANALALGIMAEQGLDSLIARLESDPPNTLIIMEADIYRHFDATRLDQLLEKVKHIVVLDQLLTRTAQMADLALPACSNHESHGCFLNAEGRLQKSIAVMPPIKLRLPSSVWLQPMSGLNNNQQILQWCGEHFPALSALAQFVQDDTSEFPLARQPLRSSSRTAIHAAIEVKEYPPAKDNGSQLTFSMEGVPAHRQQLLQQSSCPPTGIWQPQWNSGQGINKALHLNTKPDQYGLLIFADQPKTNVQLNGEKAAVSSDGVKIAMMPNIYADDELASYCTALQQLVPNPQALLSPAQAKLLNLETGQIMQIKSTTRNVELPCVIDPQIADGVVLIPQSFWRTLSADAHLGSVK